METLKAIFFLLLLAVGVFVFANYGLPLLGSTILWLHGSLVGLSVKAYDIPYLWIPFAFFTTCGLAFVGYHAFDSNRAGSFSTGTHSLTEKFGLSAIGAAALFSAAYWICGPVAGCAFYLAVYCSGPTSLLGDLTILFANLVLPMFGVWAIIRLVATLLDGGRLTGQPQA